MCWETFTCPERGPQISFTNLLYSLLFRPYDEPYWWERNITGAAMEKFWEELCTHFYGGPLNSGFSIPDWSLRWSHQLISKKQHFKFITVAPGGETGCVLQGISACHEKCSLGICKELNGLMSLPWAWLGKWLFSKKIRSEYCSMGCFLIFFHE